MGDIADFYESIMDWEEADRIQDNEIEGIWINSKGDYFEIKEMTSDHLFNCLKFAKGDKYQEIVTELRSRFYKL